MLRTIKGGYHTDVGGCVGTRDAVGAVKTQIASFTGAQFVAEREGDELVIYMISDAEGIGNIAVVAGAGDGIPTMTRPVVTDASSECGIQHVSQIAQRGRDYWAKEGAAITRRATGSRNV